MKWWYYAIIGLIIVAEGSWIAVGIFILYLQAQGPSNPALRNAFIMLSWVFILGGLWMVGSTIHIFKKH
jgi:hypothetical protein